MNVEALGHIVDVQQFSTVAPLQEELVKQEQHVASMKATLPTMRGAPKVAMQNDIKAHLVNIEQIKQHIHGIQEGARIQRRMEQKQVAQAKADTKRSFTDIVQLIRDREPRASIGWPIERPAVQPPTPPVEVGGFDPGFSFRYQNMAEDWLSRMTPQDVMRELDRRMRGLNKMPASPMKTEMQKEMAMIQNAVLRAQTARTAMRESVEAPAPATPDPATGTVESIPQPNGAGVAEPAPKNNILPWILAGATAYLLTR